MATQKPTKAARRSGLAKKPKPAARPAAKKPASRPAAKKPAARPAAKKPAAKKPAAKKLAARPAAEAKAARPPATMQIRVNGRRHELELGREIAPETTLALLLRDKLGFTGLKVACDEGACGGCTVLLDGKAVLSCMVLAVEAAGHEVVTIEGLPKDDPVIEAFAEQSEPGYGTALQCGFCTPGFVMTATALLRDNPRPTLEEIKEGLSGNICRCGCYAGIARAVQHASEKLAARRAVVQGGGQ
jgi:carbon-monoxide dehydrogenase small subunit